MEDKELKQARIVFNTFCSMLNKGGWKYHKDDDEMHIECGVAGDDLPLLLHINIDADRELIRLHSSLGNVPRGKRSEAALAICAINYLLINGCFDYDYNDGEMVFRLVNSYAGSIVGEEMCKYIFMCSCLTVDKYNDLIVKYMLGGMSLEELIAKINSD